MSTSQLPINVVRAYHWIEVSFIAAWHSYEAVLFEKGNKYSLYRTLDTKDFAKDNAISRCLFAIPEGNVVSVHSIPEKT